MGPVKAPKPSSRTRQNKDSEGSSETIDGLEVRIDSDEDESAEVSDSVEKPIRTQLPERTKKRKRGDEGDHLEGQYLRQLQVEEEQENEKSAEAREERESKLKSIVGVESTVEEVDEEDAGSGADDYSDEDSDAEHEEGKNAPPILHETMQNKNLENLDKSARTAFLAT